MDPRTRALLMGSAGAGSAEKIYVEDVFSTWLYTGNSSTQTITNGIDLSGKGGLTWIKGRSGATGHRLVDTVRGATKSLECNSPSPSAAEATESTGLTSFSSTGFSIGADADYNTSAATYASWTFRKAAKFFDVVTYTGTGANRTIAHSLGSVPGCIIVKRTDTTGDWQVYHRSLANTEYLLLNSNAAKATGTTRWNSTTPTSTEFSLGTDATVNASGGTYVAYLFAHDAGGFGNSGSDNIISCGSYTGNGSATGPVITLGWEPQWLLIKRTSTGGDPWLLVDNIRGLTTASSNRLSADTSDVEVAGTVAYIDLTPTGFQPKNATTVINGSGSTYIYIAIRRGPMKTPTDATKVFNAVTYSGLGVAQTVQCGFTPDSLWPIVRNIANGLYIGNRMIGRPASTPSSIASEYGAAYSATLWQQMDGVRFGSADEGNTSARNYSTYFLRRAPGFFDFVAYTGTAANRTISHNLGVVPELIIVKARATTTLWAVYSSAVANTEYLVFNEVSAKATDATLWNSTTPTSSVFSVGTSSITNGISQETVAYLFASCPGVSKVGTYTGAGSDVQVNCGFTNGAKFVMVKRVDSTGGWYVWDSARGIVAGNDPYSQLNSTAVEVTTTDYIDPYSLGFTITASAPAELNAANGTFLYLAIA